MQQRRPGSQCTHEAGELFFRDVVTACCHLFARRSSRACFPSYPRRLRLAAVAAALVVGAVRLRWRAYAAEPHPPHPPPPVAPCRRAPRRPFPQSCARAPPSRLPATAGAAAWRAWRRRRRAGRRRTRRGGGDIAAATAGIGWATVPSPPVPAVPAAAAASGAGTACCHHFSRRPNCGCLPPYHRRLRLAAVAAAAVVARAPPSRSPATAVAAARRARPRSRRGARRRTRWGGGRHRRGDGRRRVRHRAAAARAGCPRRGGGKGGRGWPAPSVCFRCSGAPLHPRAVSTVASPAGVHCWSAPTGCSTELTPTLPSGCTQHFSAVALALPAEAADEFVLLRRTRP